MDVISQGPRREFRLPPRRWLAAAAAVGLVVAATALVLTRAGGSRPAAAAGLSPAAVPGTVLLGCDSAANGELFPSSGAGSLQVGPLWFVGGRQSGYVHSGGPPGGVIKRGGTARLVAIVVGVQPESVVVMKPVATVRSYFRFVQGLRSGGANELPAGASGFTLVSCPSGDPATNSHLPDLTDFYLGFSIQPGRAAVVNVWPSLSSRPIRVTFTCPGTGC